MGVTTGRAANYVNAGESSRKQNRDLRVDV
jgi:hypothetical protein